MTYQTILDINKLINLSENELLLKLKTSEQGLSNKEAILRLNKYGYNELEKTKKSTFFLETLHSYANPFIIILIISSLIFCFTDNLLNSAIIIIIISISIIVDCIQYQRTLFELEKIHSQIAINCFVLRENKIREINSKELVPGDVVLLNAGNLVPADAILLSSKNLTIQQSLLTGESYPYEKKSGATTLNYGQNIFEAKNAIYSETSVISGSAKAVIINTGTKTEFGKLSKSVKQSRSKTDFEIGLTKLGIFISKTILFLILFVLLISILLKRDFLNSLIFSAALAVGLTPEFLPMMITVNLASGAIKMSKQHVIIKNIAAMLNFGSIDILCSDKTGTLTAGTMDLTQYLDVFGKQNKKVLLYSYLNSLVCSQQNKINLHPLDNAILRNIPSDIPPYVIIDEIPFDFEKRRSTVIINTSKSNLLITKGAPEYVLNISRYYEINETVYPLNNEIKNKFISLYESYSRNGYKILCVSYSKMFNTISYNLPEGNNLVLLGILVFSDPLIPDVANFISDLKSNGIQVKILTGDNHLVAKNICHQVGIKINHAINSPEIDKMSEQALKVCVERSHLFTRVTPLQKLRIVTALKQKGHVVGYLGDSINDAPSLKEADIGISVSNAVEIAKKSSDVILLKQDLKVLLKGILEGRKAYGNIIKYLIMSTSSNFGNMCSMAGAVLFLPFLPMLPVQLLLNNFLYDLSQLTIPTDNIDSIFTKKPRHWDIDIIKRCMFTLGPISTIFDFLTFYVLSVLFFANESAFQTGWFMESLATQTLVILVIRTSENPFKSHPSIPLVFSVSLSISLGFIIPLTPLASKFGFVSLPSSFYYFSIFATILYLCLVQSVKQNLIFKWFK